jgi:hypothetical protein
MKIAALRLVALPGLLALLSGCVETRFESPPGDNIETCDVQWKGLWGDPDSATEPGAIYVDDECHFIVLDQPERGAPLKQIHVPMNFVHVDGKNYLVVTDAALKGLVELKPPHGIDPPPDKSFFFARYRLRGDRVELNQVDSERVAKLVIDGVLDGSVDKVGNDLHVFVRGNRARMLDIIRTQPIFATKSPTVLVRRKQTLDEFEQALLKAQHQASP